MAEHRSWAPVLVVGLLAALVVSAAAGKPTPASADPPPPAGVIAVAPGFFHSCALRANGTVKCWGAGFDGILGNGSETGLGPFAGGMGGNLPTVALGTGRTATAIDIGGDGSDQSHTCALLDNGSVKCWGANGYGQLGLGDTANRGDDPGEMGDNLPAVNLGTGRTATAISTRSWGTCALLDNGTVKCWGNNQYGQAGTGDVITRGDGPNEMGDNLPAVNLGTGRTATAISAAERSTCALLDNATVKCWGSGGSLGLGDTNNRGDGPNEMGDNLPAVNLGTGRTAVELTAGDLSACAILDNGALKCWGYHNYGALGLGDTNNRGDGPNEMGDDLPTVDLGSGRTAVSVDSGAGHTCVVLDNGALRCWGHNYRGKLGLGNTSDRGDDPGEMGDFLPTVDLGSGRTASAASAAHGHVTCALLDNATVKCWGYNLHGQAGTSSGDNIGDGPGEMGDNLPIVVLDASPTVAVAADESSVALGGTIHVHVTVTNPGDQALTGVVVDGGNATECDSVLQVLAAGAQQTVDCVHSTTGMDLPSFTARASVTTTQTPSAVLSSQLTVPVTLSPTIGAISGTITRSVAGTPIADGLIALLSPADFSLVGYANARANGTYSTIAAPGNYYVYALDPAGAHLPGFVGSPTQVAVTGGATTSVNPTLAPAAGSFAGTITETSSTAPLNNVLVVSLDTATGQAGAGAVTNGSGAYTVSPLPAGSRFGIFVDLAGAHVPEFYNDSTSITGAQPITVGGGTTTGINAALTASTPPAGGAIIQGTVSDSVTHGALNGVAVLALRAGDFSLVGGTITGSGGTYNLDLEPGPYKLAFYSLAGSHFMEWHDDQPASGLGSAATVTATAGVPTSVNAALDPATGTAAGTVTEGGTGDPLADVWVIAISATGRVRSSTTGANGAYSIAGLSPGPYRLRFVDPTDAHASEYHVDAPGPDAATPITVNGGQTTTIDAALAALP